MSCCTGSTFTPAPGAALDPTQRVNYTFGMVLGVDDFRQEQAYLMARDERALRETIGYGVLHGLGVNVVGNEVRVAPGTALMPDGRLVAITQEQCASYQTWLDAQAAAGKTPAKDATVYVLLQHADVTGTPVPIPGEPCRDESALAADARIADSFSLTFAWTAPDAAEELALRAVVSWIRGIKIRTSVPATQTLKSFQTDVERGLREAITTAWGDPHAPTPAQPAAATPALPTPSKASLPAPPVELQIPRADVAAYYAAAFEVWTRLLRAGFMAHHGPEPAAEALAERALLLAAIDVKSVAGDPQSPAPGQVPRVRLLGRPQLLHLRLLQEWLLRDGTQDAPREAHYVLGKGDPELDHAQDLLADFAAHNHALTRIDIVPDTTDGGSGNKAKIVPAVKWPGAGGPAGGPDYYGPGMSQPIPVADGGTGQNVAPAQGQLLVGVAAAAGAPARFVLGNLVGAALTKPLGASPNILVDASGGAPNLRLDTVQDIGITATPVFAGLTINGLLTTTDLVAQDDVSIQGDLSVDGGLTLGSPLSSVLATDDSGVVVAARGWDGDEDSLDAGKPPPYVYRPGQPTAVRIEDGGTGLQTRPRKMQVLIGVEQASLRGDGGDYVQATLVDGKNTALTLTPPRDGDGGTRGWELRIDASGGGTATQVVAAGNAASPANLTAVATGSRVVIDSVQALHPGAQPRFNRLNLTAPPEQAGATLLGWDATSNEVVRTSAPAPAAADVGVWPVRYLRTARDQRLLSGDQVLVNLVAGRMALPDLNRGGIDEGRVIVLKATPNGPLGVANVEGGTLSLDGSSSITVIAATKLDPPQWLVIGRS